MLKKIINKFSKTNRLVKKFTSDPEFPWLISFPRTGSHWLRLLMELYFEKPSLTRTFYYHDVKDFTCYHQHDEDLSIKNIKNVLYLYRNPMDTVYSQMNYYKENMDDEARIKYWSELYGSHLSKWLFEEKFTIKKTVLTYEGLKNNINREFKKICDHFEEPFISSKFDLVIAKVNKEELKKKTKHDNQVVNLSHSYESQRENFGKNYGEYIMKCVSQQNKELKSLFTITVQNN